MVERIDKTDRVDLWKISATAETYKEKGQEQESGGDGYSTLGEKTDWRLLFDKSKLWKRDIRIPESEIDKVLFGKLNLKTDPSLLRVDILLKNKELISPAFLAIARVVGFKLKNLQAGATVPLHYILQGDILRITIPANPALFKEQERKNQAAKVEPNNETGKKSSRLPDRIRQAHRDLLHSLEAPLSRGLKAETILVVGTFFIILSLLAGVYFLLR